jgi:hypothetical protein
MEDEGFSRTIESDDDINYHLPTAEYRKQGNYTLQNVLDSAKLAADKTEKKYSILVTEYKTAKWHKLTKV